MPVDENSQILTAIGQLRDALETKLDTVRRDMETKIDGIRTELRDYPKRNEIATIQQDIGEIKGRLDRQENKQEQVRVDLTGTQGDLRSLTERMGDAKGQLREIATDTTSDLRDDKKQANERIMTICGIIMSLVLWLFTFFGQHINFK